MISNSRLIEIVSLGVIADKGVATFREDIRPVLEQLGLAANSGYPMSNLEHQRKVVQIGSGPRQWRLSRRRR